MVHPPSRPPLRGAALFSERDRTFVGAYEASNREDRHATPEPCEPSGESVRFGVDGGGVWPITDANEAAALTGEISQALNSGRHTTTTTTWYWLDAQRQSAIIDSPGFQEFGLHHLDRMHLASLMPDLRAHVPECRFYNCTHRHEPGCGVQAAVGTPVESGGIHPSRYRIYGELFDELAAPRY